jgi:PIN domain nuclease of toxin-antitoxin system
MRLVDTNALLWAMANAPHIEPVRDLSLDSGNEMLVSAVFWWEIAIKKRLGKLDAGLPEPRTAARESGFMELPLLGGIRPYWQACPVIIMTLLTPLC